MGRVIDSLGHETRKVGVEASNILQRCHDSNIPIWSDNDDGTRTTVNPVCRISHSASVERNAYVVNEDSEGSPNCQP